MDMAIAFEDSEPFRLPVGPYLKLIKHAAVEEGSRVELIEGLLVCMNAQAKPHLVLVNELTFRLRVKLAELGSPLIAYVGPTVIMPPRNAPDPDIMVGARPSGQGYVAVDQVSVLIEVSDTTLRKDLQLKRQLYALAGVPEYWVVDVNGERIHRFWQPAAGVYLAEPPIPLAGELRSLTMPDLMIDGSGIL